MNRQLKSKILCLSAALIASSPFAFAQSTDLSPEQASVPGMQKTTTARTRGATGGISAGLTPGATGRSYPSSGALQIGQGDLLHIEVFDTPEFMQDERVDTAGDIQVMGLGVVHVQDMKPSDVSAMLEKRFKEDRIMLAPQITVQIVDFISHGVALNGEVRSPGIYPILGGRRLSDLLVAAGGVTELSDGRLEILHPGNPVPQSVFLPKDGDSVMVVPGDVVSVERAPLVYILGNVRRPGGFPLARPTSLIQALALANGFAPSAVDKHAVLFRDSEGGTRIVEDLNLHDILRGKRSDIALRGGDILFVPNSAIKDIAKAAAAVLPGVASAAIYQVPNL